jgi:hypothetical protein
MNTNTLKFSYKGKFVPVFNQSYTKSWRRMGECRYSSTIFDVGTRSGVVGFTPRPLFRQGKSLRYPMYRRLGCNTSSTAASRHSIRDAFLCCVCTGHYLATSVSLPPQFLLWANTPQYVSFMCVVQINADALTRTGLTLLKSKIYIIFVPHTKRTVAITNSVTT